jgi:hypothetical protein
MRKHTLGTEFGSSSPDITLSRREIFSNPIAHVEADCMHETSIKERDAERGFPKKRLDVCGLRISGLL